MHLSPTLPSVYQVWESLGRGNRRVLPQDLTGYLLCRLKATTHKCRLNSRVPCLVHGCFVLSLLPKELKKVRECSSGI